MFSSRPPRKGSGLPYWDFIRLDPGKEWVGWLAGPIVGVEVHYWGGSRACRRVMTGGALKCVCDAQEVSTIWRGYVPLWDEHGIRCCALIGARYFDLAAGVKHLDPVKVTKTKRQGCPIRVESRAWTSGKPPVSNADLKPQDVRPWLLRLWRDNDLAKWLAENPGVTLKTTDAPLAPESFTPMLREPARRANESSRLPPMVGDVLPLPPTPNGKRKH